MTFFSSKVNAKNQVVFKPKGSVIRKARKAKGFTQRSLAERMGCTAAFICDVENNRRSMSPIYREKLVRALK